MTELSPEDISRARELAAEHIVKSRLFERTHISLLDNLTIPYSSRKIRDFVTAEVMADFALAYSAAENERLTLECDRLKGALERIEEFATTEAQSSRDLDAGDAAEWDKVVKMAAPDPQEPPSHIEQMREMFKASGIADPMCDLTPDFSLDEDQIRRPRKDGNQ